MGKKSKFAPTPETKPKTMSENTSKPEDRDNDEVSLEPKLPKIISFESLARCGDEIWIENEGQIYRLRKTRQGKLILTK